MKPNLGLILAIATLLFSSSCGSFFGQSEIPISGSEVGVRTTQKIEDEKVYDTTFEERLVRNPEAFEVTAMQAAENAKALVIKYGDYVLVR